jgi:hypothetical protein
MLGLPWDTATINRPPATGDAEGNPTGTLTQVATGVLGSWLLATVREQNVAAQRGQTVDAVFSCASNQDIAIGDQVIVRGHTYEVVTILDVRTHQRAMLRLMV